MVPKINFPYFKPRVSLYGEPNLDEAIRSKCRLAAYLVILLLAQFCMYNYNKIQEGVEMVALL